MRLIDAPAGLFVYCGYLGMKTEYMMNGCVEAYVVASGERFWGGAKRPEEVNNLIVTPVEPYDLRLKGKWEGHHTSRYGAPAYVCSCCLTIWESAKIKNMNYCPTCGAKMELNKEADSVSTDNKGEEL